MSFLIAPRVLEFILSFVVLRYPSSRISTLASWIRMLDRNLPRKDETSFLLSVAASRFSEIPLLRPFSILRGRHGVPRRLPFDYEYPPRARLFSPTLYQYALVFFGAFSSPTRFSRHLPTFIARHRLRPCRHGAPIVRYTFNILDPRSHHPRW
jgi:hypothetical protein